MLLLLVLRVWNRILTVMCILGTPCFTCILVCTNTLGTAYTYLACLILDHLVFPVNLQLNAFMHSLVLSSIFPQLLLAQTRGTNLTQSFVLLTLAWLGVPILVEALAPPSSTTSRPPLLLPHVHQVHLLGRVRVRDHGGLPRAALLRPVWRPPGMHSFGVPI